MLNSILRVRVQREETSEWNTKQIIYDTHVVCLCHFICNCVFVFVCFCIWLCVRSLSFEFSSYFGSIFSINRTQTFVLGWKKMFEIYLRPLFKCVAIKRIIAMQWKHKHNEPNNNRQEFHFHFISCHFDSEANNKLMYSSCCKI